MRCHLLLRGVMPKRLETVCQLTIEIRKLRKEEQVVREDLADRERLEVLLGLSLPSAPAYQPQPREYI